METFKIKLETPILCLKKTAKSRTGIYKVQFDQVKITSSNWQIKNKREGIFIKRRMVGLEY